MAMLPKLKLKALVSFPSNVYGGTGIDVNKANGNFTIDLDYREFAFSGTLPPGSNTLVWDPVTDTYILVPPSAVGGISDAPSDSLTYGRNNAAWVPVVGGGGSGDVVGPAVAVDDRIATFSGTTGKIIKDGGKTLAGLTADFVNVTGDTMTGTLGVPTIVVGPSVGFIEFGYSDTKMLLRGGTDGLQVNNHANSVVLFTLSDAGLAAFVVSPTAPTPSPGDSTTKVATTAFVQSALGSASAPNVIINGDFRVNQSVYVSGAVLAAGAYGHDQWKAGAAGGDYSFTQLKSSTQITIASGKSLIQPIEDVNVVGGSYVLSWTGTAQARAGVNTLTPAGAYAASPLLITGQTAGTVMSIEFNTGTLGKVKLEIGSVATPFVMRPFDQELVTCKRYWEKSYDYATALGTITFAGEYQIDYGTNTTTSGGATVLLEMRKRITPSITTYDDAGTPGKMNATPGNGITPIIDFIGERSFRLSAPAGAGACTYMRFQWTANARL